MALIEPHLSDVVTTVNNRVITYGGVSIVDPSEFDPPSSQVLKLLKTPGKVRVSSITPAIKQYNLYAENKVSTPSMKDFVSPQPEFILPPKYKSMKIVNHLRALLVDDCKRCGGTQQRSERFADELEWFVLHDKLDVLRTMAYIVDTLSKNSVPWGVGRGSSIHSYLLFLLGVHDVDPIRYDLNWRDFLRDTAQ